MKSIYKYPFDVESNFEITMSINSQILSVQVQNNIPCIWALGETGNAAVTRQFILFGTGHPIYNSDELKYIGTFQQDEFVWHLFELIL